MKVFISYAAIDADLAESMAIRLRERGHEVFFDRQQLPPGGSYDLKIREFLHETDLLIFLARPESVAPGAYAMTEVGWFKEECPIPAGRVLTVKTQPMPFKAIPAYLRSVTVLEATGDLTAETLGHAMRMLEGRGKKRLGVIAAAAAGLAVLAGAIFLIFGNRPKGDPEFRISGDQIQATGELTDGTGGVFRLTGKLRMPKGVSSDSKIGLEFKDGDYRAVGMTESPSLEGAWPDQSISLEFKIREKGGQTVALDGVPAMSWRLFLQPGVSSATSEVRRTAWKEWAGTATQSSTVLAELPEPYSSRSRRAASTGDGYVLALTGPAEVVFFDGKGQRRASSGELKGEVECLHHSSDELVVGMRNPARLLIGRVEGNQFAHRVVAIGEMTFETSSGSEMVSTLPKSIARHGKDLWVVTGEGSGEPGLLRLDAADQWHTVPYADGFTVDPDALLLRPAGGELWSYNSNVTPTSLYVLQEPEPVIFGGHDHDLISNIEDLADLRDNHFLALTGRGELLEIQRDKNRLDRVATWSAAFPADMTPGTWHDSVLARSDTHLWAGIEMRHVGNGEPPPYLAEVYRMAVSSREPEAVWRRTDTALVSLAAFGPSAVLVSRTGSKFRADRIDPRD